MNIEIIFDNGGGATLQDRDNNYMHYYQNMDQLANDVIDLKDGGTTLDWDGNEFEEYLQIQKDNAEDPDEIEEDDIFIDPSYDDIRNGGYRVFTIEDLLDYAKNIDIDDISWGNIRDTVQALI